MSNNIDAGTKTVRMVLGQKYSVDFYQREYKWRDKQVEELVNDLVGAFIPQWAPEHDSQMIRNYRGYFLGSIIVSDRDGIHYIVDGQQRLTTLTLLLIALLGRMDEERRGQLADLIRSVQFGEKKFNLDIPEREECLTALYDGAPFDEEGQPESVRNILRRYREIEDLLDGLKADEEDFPFPYFADWLIELVCLVEIKATSDEDAYTVFETMNDRGLSLTPTEMLKGYLLAKIPDSETRREAEGVWKEQVGKLVDYGKDEDADAIKAWLRGRHANSIRERKRNAAPRDFDRIGSEFHRWVRDKERVLELKSSCDFKRFIAKEFKFYSDWYLRLRRAADDISTAGDDGLESVCHNAEFRFTLQYPALLAVLSPDESDAIALPKLRVTSAYLDILIHRRIWSGRTISYSAMTYAMYLLMRELRNKDAHAIAECLVDRLDDPFMSADVFSKHPHFRLHGQNKPAVRRILARITAVLEQWATGENYIQRYAEYAKYEIEHIWADKFAQHRHDSEFDNETDFYEFRNRIGGLLLLRKSDNASYNDKPYAGADGKREFYLRQNLLAQSLHEKCYENNPGFLRRTKDKYNLPFKPHSEFKKSDLEERQALYVQIAEQIWNPARLLELANGD